MMSASRFFFSPSLLVRCRAGVRMCMCVCVCFAQSQSSVGGDGGIPRVSGLTGIEFTCAR